MGRNPAIGRQGPKMYSATIPTEAKAKRIRVKQIRSGIGHAETMRRTLRALGLYSERTAAHFKQMWTETQGREAAERYASSKAELPEDLEAWVNEGHEAP